MDKKGMELPSNAIIVLVIAVIVLIVFATFFMGGASGILQKISSIFRGGAADVEVAIETCRTLCGIAERLPETGAARKFSGYCRNYFYLDIDRDGRADFVEGGVVKGGVEVVGNKEVGGKIRYYCCDVKGDRGCGGQQGGGQGEGQQARQGPPRAQIPGAPSCDVSCG